MSKHTKQSLSYLIMYGLGEDSRPRAARFQSSDRTTVEKAAGLMRFNLVEAKAEHLIKLAKQLPAGKIFATGRSLVPYVRQPIYEQLIAAIGPRGTAKPRNANANGSEKPRSTNAHPGSEAPVTNAKGTLQTTALIGLSSAERQKLLSAWPARDRKIPEFCEALIATWEAIWLSGITATFGERVRVFEFADFQKCDLAYFAPTVFRCWQQRTVWGVHLVDKQWHLWTAIASAKDSRAVALMFDITDANDSRHPALTIAKLDNKVWRFVANRYYEAFSTGQMPVALTSASSAEMPKLAEVAKDAIAVALSLLPAVLSAPANQG